MGALVVGGNAARDLQVLGVLLLQDVKRVVDGDDAQQVAVVGHDGHGEQVVLGDVLGHVLLVVLGAGGDDLARADVCQRGLRLGYDEAVERDHAGELVVFVGEVHVADALEVLVQAAQQLHGVGDGLALGEGGKLGGHDAACGVLAVPQQLADGALLLDAHEA